MTLRSSLLLLLLAWIDVLSSSFFVTFFFSVEDVDGTTSADGGDALRLWESLARSFSLACAMMGSNPSTATCSTP